MQKPFLRQLDEEINALFVRGRYVGFAVAVHIGDLKLGSDAGIVIDLVQDIFDI